MKKNEDVTTKEMQSAGVHTDAHNLRLSGVTHIESGPTRRVRWASIAAPVLRRAGSAGDPISDVPGDD